MTGVCDREGSTVTEVNKQLVRRHFDEIFNKRNLDVCDELMAEDYVEHGIAAFAEREPGRVNGPEAMKGTARWLLAQFPDLHMEIEAIVAEGDLVVCRVRSRGTNKGALSDAVPATNKSFEATASHWFRVANGRLAEHWSARDDLTAMLQLGVVTRPAPPG